MREETERAICAGYALRIRRQIPGSKVWVRMVGCEAERDDGTWVRVRKCGATVEWRGATCTVYWPMGETPDCEPIRRKLLARLGEVAT